MNSSIKNDFIVIRDIKNDVENILSYIQNKIDTLQILYNDYLKQINDSDNYRISLDTFKFQTKLITIEHDNYTKILKIFINRMYGDYYKLYKKLNNFINENQTINLRTRPIDDYPKYKDLEILNDYSFDLIEEIFSESLNILSELNNICLKENHYIKEIEKKQNNGLNINSLVNEKIYSTIILEQKIKFYNETIKGYLDFQHKFLKRLSLKLKLIYTQISNDINLETSLSNNEYKKNKNNQNINYNSDNSDDSNEILLKKINSISSNNSCVIEELQISNDLVLNKVNNDSSSDNQSETNSDLNNNSNNSNNSCNQNEDIKHEKNYTENIENNINLNENSINLDNINKILKEIDNKEQEEDNQIEQSNKKNNFISFKKCFCFNKNKNLDNNNNNE
jgi:hypothetical protein